jgi:hypothetical protein
MKATTVPISRLTTVKVESIVLVNRFAGLHVLSWAKIQTDNSSAAGFWRSFLFSCFFLAIDQV